MAEIYTCTMNLAIDLFIEVETLIPHVVNRGLDDDIQANGKGVNVSLVLNMLGLKSTALGFSGGFTGNYIQQFLQEKDVATDFIQVEGMTRINVFTQVNKPTTEYKLVNKGPVIQEEQIAALIKQIEAIPKDSYLCISGSFPQGVSPAIIEQISAIAYKNKVNLIIDTSYSTVMNCLSYRPFLLKPNEEELAQWFGKDTIDYDECIQLGKQLVDRGAQHVLISLGEQGALFITPDKVIHGNAPKGEVVNTACSGDTLLGSFIGNFLHQLSPEENLKKSLAAASSTAFRKGLTDFSDTAELEKQITIRTIEGGTTND